MVNTCLSRARIVTFVDGNPVNQGKKFAGIDVKAPSQIVGLNYPILITSILHQKEIESTIRKIGLSNRVLVLS